MASIRKRGNSFTITAYLGYDDEGRQIKKTTTFRPPEGVTPGKAEKLAKAYAVKWEDEIRGFVALDENKTFAELADWYYSTIAPAVLKPKTLIDYQRSIQIHILPIIGREKLKNITPAMLDQLFAKMQQTGNTRKHFALKQLDIFEGTNCYKLSIEKGLNRTTLHRLMNGETTTQKQAEKIAAALDIAFSDLFEDRTEKSGLSGTSTNTLKMNLSAIFTAAVKKEIMRRNPCKLVTPAKNDAKPAVYLTERECQILLDYLRKQDDFQYEVIINLFLATGIRSGELCALHWEDIDFETGVMYIRHTLVYLHGQYTRSQPKTIGSNRRIVLPKYILDLLKKHKREQAIQRMKDTEIWSAPEAVFTNKSHNYLPGSDINRKLHECCANAGISDIHVHSLRHTHASLLINSNVAAKIIADRLGHQTTQTTLDTYSHVFAESEVKAMQAIDMKLFHTVADEAESTKNAAISGS